VRVAAPEAALCTGVAERVARCACVPASPPTLRPRWPSPTPPGLTAQTRAGSDAPLALVLHSAAVLLRRGASLHRRLRALRTRVLAAGGRSRSARARAAVEAASAAAEGAAAEEAARGAGGRGDDVLKAAMQVAPLRRARPPFG
jgi:hypothetical protein